MTTIRFRLLMKALATGSRDEKGSRVESIEGCLNSDDIRTTISDEDFDDLPDLVPFIAPAIVNAPVNTPVDTPVDTPVNTPVNTPQNDNEEIIAVNITYDLQVEIESIKQKIFHLSTDYENIKNVINNLNESVNETLKKQVITRNDTTVTPVDTPMDTSTNNQALRINAIEEAIAIYQKFPGFEVRSVQAGVTIAEIIDNTIIIQK
jgi:hypothetical protein